MIEAYGRRPLRRASPGQAEDRFICSVGQRFDKADGYAQVIGIIQV